jgi:integrase
MHISGKVFPISSSSARHAFDEAVKNAGLEDFRFHDLRHTFGSHLAMRGVNTRTIQQVMGHKEIKMTMRYSHLSPEYVQEAVEKLDNLVDTIWTPRQKDHQGYTS